MRELNEARRRHSDADTALLSQLKNPSKWPELEALNFPRGSTKKAFVKTLLDKRNEARLRVD